MSCAPRGWPTLCAPWQLFSTPMPSRGGGWVCSVSPALTLVLGCGGSGTFIAWDSYSLLSPGIHTREERKGTLDENTIHSATHRVRLAARCPHCVARQCASNGATSRRSSGATARASPNSPTRLRATATTAVSLRILRNSAIAANPTANASSSTRSYANPSHAARGSRNLSVT